LIPKGYFRESLFDQIVKASFNQIKFNLKSGLLHKVSDRFRLFDDCRQLSPYLVMIDQIRILSPFSAIKAASFFFTALPLCVHFRSLFSVSSRKLNSLSLLVLKGINWRWCYLQAGRIAPLAKS